MPALRGHAFPTFLGPARNRRNGQALAGELRTPADSSESTAMLKEMLGMAEGILQDLHNDHQEVAKLIDSIMESEDGRQRATLFKEMMTKLLAHSKAEAQVLYAPMKKSDDEEVRSFALEGDNEHEHVEIQLKEMARASSKTSEQWTAELT